MATRQTTAGATSTALLDTANGDRERVFDAFRQWGYLEADLDPLGFLPKSPLPELQIAGELAREARGLYCGTVGVEFMHIAEPERRKWIQERKNIFLSWFTAMALLRARVFLPRP